MIESVKAALTWPGMTESIRSWVRNCKTCARSKDRKAKYGKIPAKTVEVRPWAEIAVDTLGPLGTKHHWRALTIIDTSTRLLEIANMDDGTSAEAARIVDQVWFNRYPRPERCIYDQGPEFRKEFRELLQKRSHRSINNKLRTESISTKEEWENLLSSVMFVMRAQHHTMTGLAASQAAFGQDMLFDVPVEVDWKQQQQRKQRQIQKAVQRENQGRLEHEYCPEDLVMISRSDPQAPNLQQIYEGPFPVVSVRSDSVLVIDKGAYQERIHMRRIKPYKSSTMGEDVMIS
ncbi:Pol protein [Phytophthora palmivora]|uniref:Pol protein n=1 Tax=Phytophthora palmivora TaxID=4796 RepID=A0A2P4XFF1_9STRA|nr:Pol protein [Phytophthora palmivora]